MLLKPCFSVPAGHFTSYRVRFPGPEHHISTWDPGSALFQPLSPAALRIFSLSPAPHPAVREPIPPLPPSCSLRANTLPAPLPAVRRANTPTAPPFAVWTISFSPLPRFLQSGVPLLSCNKRPLPILPSIGACLVLVAWPLTFVPPFEARPGSGVPASLLRLPLWWVFGVSLYCPASGAALRSG